MQAGPARLWIGGTVAAILLVAGLLTGPVRSAGSPERIAIDLTERRFDALSRLDISTLRGILADDYRYIGWRGELLTRAERLRVIGSLRGTQDAEAFSLSELDARQEGESVVVVTGHAHQTGRFRGRPFDHAYRFTTVFALRDDSWRAVAHQTTQIAEDG